MKKKDRLKERKIRESKIEAINKTRDIEYWGWWRNKEGEVKRGRIYREREKRKRYERGRERKYKYEGRRESEI